MNTRLYVFGGESTNVTTNGAIVSDILAARPLNPYRDFLDVYVVLERRDDNYHPFMVHYMNPENGETDTGSYHESYDEAYAEFMRR